MADTFLNNPLVGAIGTHLGLAGLIDGDAGGDFMGEGGPGSGPPPSGQNPSAPPPAPKPGKSNVNPQENREFRQHALMPKSGAAQRGSSPDASRFMGGLPGVMSPDVLMHPDVQALLGRYGVTPQHIQDTVNNTDPNLFIHNPAAFQKHPILANGIERALEGLAFTHGSSNAGEAMTNIAQGILGAHAARVSQVNNQLMMPFEQAQQVANLQKDANADDRAKSQQDWEQKREQHIDDQNAHWQDQTNMLRDYHDQLVQTKAAHDQLVNRLSQRKVPLNANGIKAWQQAVQEAGGEDKVPEEVMDGIYQDVRNRAAIPKVFAPRVPSITGQITPKDTFNDQAAALKDSAKSADDDLHSFESSLRSGTAQDENGKMIIAGSKSAASARAKYQAARDKAKQALHDHLNSAPNVTPMSIPGTGMTPKKTNSNLPPAGAKIKEYDVKTGTFH